MNVECACIRGEEESMKDRATRLQPRPLLRESSLPSARDNCALYSSLPHSPENVFTIENGSWYS